LIWTVIIYNLRKKKKKKSMYTYSMKTRENPLFTVEIWQQGRKVSFQKNCIYLRSIVYAMGDNLKKILKKIGCLTLLHCISDLVYFVSFRLINIWAQFTTFQFTFKSKQNTKKIVTKTMELTFFLNTKSAKIAKKICKISNC